MSLEDDGREHSHMSDYKVVAILRIEKGDRVKVSDKIKELYAKPEGRYQYPNLQDKYGHVLDLFTRKSDSTEMATVEFCDFVTGVPVEYINKA